jgi:leader peptidase (prepilin peptidase) / N-methyltransferase
VTATAGFAAAGGLAALVASPWLASLTITAVDTAARDWWRPGRVSLARWSVTALPAAAFGALAGVAAHGVAPWPAFLVLAWCGAVLTVVDLEHHRLPDRIIAAAGVAGAGLLAVAAGVDRSWARFAHAAVAGVVVLTLLYLLALISPRGVGLGDVKLAALLGGYLGWRSWSAVIDGLALGFLAAGVVGIGLLVAGRANRGSHIPLAPFVITGALVAAAIPGG